MKYHHHQDYILKSMVKMLDSANLGDIARKGTPTAAEKRYPMLSHSLNEVSPAPPSQKQKHQCSNRCAVMEGCFVVFEFV